MSLRGHFLFVRAFKMNENFKGGRKGGGGGDVLYHDRFITRITEPMHIFIFVN